MALNPPPRYFCIGLCADMDNHETASLVELRSKSRQKIIKCAISIILGETSEARTLLDELPTEDRIRITDYPIYTLLD